MSAENLYFFYCWIVLIVGILGFISGIFLILGQSLMKKATEILSRWFSLVPLIDVLDARRGNVDGWILVRSKMAGIILSVISIILILIGLPALYMK